MPPVITNNGIQQTDLTDNIIELQNAFRAAFGTDLNLESETVQGQLIGLLGLGFAQLDEAIVSVAAGMNLETAVNNQIDDWGVLLQIPRIEGSVSTVEATVTGTGGTVIEAGSRARTTAGNLFESVAAVTIPALGSIAAQFRSVEEGPIQAPAGSLTQIVDLITGWNSVTNIEAASIGRNLETDLQYRNRYSGLTARATIGSRNAIISRVLEVENASRCKVYDNPSGSAITRQNVVIGERSILVIAEGGLNAAIAQAIYESSPAAIPVIAPDITNRVSQTVESVVYQFLTVVNLPVTVEVTITVENGFPANGVLQIQQRVSDWAEGLWKSGVDDFDTRGLDIGQTIDIRRLLSPINSVPGHMVTNLELKDSGGNALVNTLDLYQRFTIAFENVVIVVS